MCLLTNYKIQYPNPYKTSCLLMILKLISQKYLRNDQKSIGSISIQCYAFSFPRLLQKGFILKAQNHISVVVISHENGCTKPL